MNYKSLMRKVDRLPCFTTRFLAAGENLTQIRLQLARWVKDGRVVRIHKGVYTLAEPYRKVKPDLLVVANTVKTPSYVSLHTALSWHGMIPEQVKVVTSVTTGRPQEMETPLGRFAYRHVHLGVFEGYRRVALGDQATALLARPEKALLDLVYLTPGGDKREFLAELRLQNLTLLDKKLLERYAGHFPGDKMNRAVGVIKEMIDEGEGEEL